QAGAVDAPVTAESPGCQPSRGAGLLLRRYRRADRLGLGDAGADPDAHLDLGRGFEDRGRVRRRVDGLGQVGTRRIAHAFGPDVESPLPRGRDLPEAPDALPLVEALVGHVVLADVALGPVALAVVEVVLPADQERADPVASLAGHGPLAEAQVQLHLMAAGPVLHQEEPGPRAGREPRIGLLGRGFGPGAGGRLRRRLGHRIAGL